jgi:hypothetical protein
VVCCSIRFLLFRDDEWKTNILELQYSSNSHRLNKLFPDARAELGRILPSGVEELCSVAASDERRVCLLRTGVSLEAMSAW